MVECQIIAQSHKRDAVAHRELLLLLVLLLEDAPRARLDAVEELVELLHAAAAAGTGRVLARSQQTCKRQ